MAVGFYIAGLIGSLVYLLKKKTGWKPVLLLLTGSLAALGMWVSGEIRQKEGSLKEIRRENRQGTEKMWELKAKAEEETRSIQIRVAPQAYEIDELQALSETLWERLKETIAGEQGTLDCVREDMSFPEAVEGYPFRLRWLTSDPGLLSGEGKIGPDVPEEGAAVEITLQILQEESRFMAEHSFSAKLFPKSGREAFWNRLETHMEKMEENTRATDKYILPDHFEGKKLSFFPEKTEQSGKIFLLFLFGAVLAAAGEKRESEKQDKARRAEMEQEYPEIISRMSMLVGAGMTISGAFRRIAGEYGRQKQEKSRPLYEELMTACREMEAGIPEIRAYQNMGKRCGLPCVIRFTALLSQFAKSGASGLKHALHEETAQALKERRERARRKGEEAGTKLLFPMILMLVLVMIIIMIPAFTSFG